MRLKLAYRPWRDSFGKILVHSRPDGDLRMQVTCVQHLIRDWAALKSKERQQAILDFYEINYPVIKVEAFEEDQCSDDCAVVRLKWDRCWLCIKAGRQPSNSPGPIGEDSSSSD